MPNPLRTRLRNTAVVAALLGGPVLSLVFAPAILTRLGLESAIPAWRGNPEARHCANCSSFIMQPLLEYAQKHDGAFPPADDATLIADLNRACAISPADIDRHLFASGLNGHHDRANPRGSFAYVNGLRADDTLPVPEVMRGGPHGFEYGPILFYLREPTVWECERHKMPEPGRVVLTVSGGGRFRFLPEPVFQRALAATRELLAAGNRGDGRANK